ncbi:AAA family ATPase [Photobacterium kishitanii]|uniref:AAA family ATPase n=1 Tax=Photobacterium kishitanii TaxID=318456 RepID=UPI00071AEBC2|nr:AAA family ATPase [Photobacterium kishitanii]
MHISKLSLVNYRNFSNSKLLFSKGINTLIGENGSGKTNLFRAIRLLLDNTMPRSSLRLQENDFCRNLGDWRGHWIIISLEFNDIADDEVSQSLFLHGVGNVGVDAVEKATYNLIFRPKAYIRQSLSELVSGDFQGLEKLRDTICIDDYETIITGKNDSDFNDESIYQMIVGDFENVKFPRTVEVLKIGALIPNILSMSDEVSFTFVKALRDVVSDFHNNRTNPLLTLLKRKGGEIKKEDFDPIAEMVDSLNISIESLPDVGQIRADIKETINDSVGDTYSPKSISIKSGLSDEADQLFQSLKLFVDESDDGYEGGIHEMSLGGANLIYLTLKLLEFKYQKGNQLIANFLLIEEPEAHIHTHIQKSLFDKINYSNTQIIYSTHSSHISEVSNIQNVNIIGKVNGQCSTFQPATGLTTKQLVFVQRYLDAIRSNLLFAKSVILIEGDAEEILIPILIKKALGVSLDELGISLVNIRSTGFENIALLFHDERIKKKCSILTDSDEIFFDVAEVSTDSKELKKKKKKAIGSQTSGASRKVILDSLCYGNKWLMPFYADHTFEVDFIKSGNKHFLIEIVEDVYTKPATINKAKSELNSDDISISGQRALTMANNEGKGWFAITLGNAITFDVIIPDYIIDAVMFSHGTMKNVTIIKILQYRLNEIEKYIKAMRKNLTQYSGDAYAKYRSDWDAYLVPIESGLAVFKPKWLKFISEDGDVQWIKSQMIKDIPFPGSNILLKV